jgi:hypothetical protein
VVSEYNAAAMNARLFVSFVAIFWAAFSFASDDKNPAQPKAPSVDLSGTFGVTLVDGATDSQTYNFLVSADRANKGVDSMHLDLGYFFSRDKTGANSAYSVTSNFAFINGRYDRNVSQQLAVYGSAGYREDNPNNLSLRSVYGGGLSYNVQESTVWKWNLSGGAAYLTESYTDGSSRKSTPSAAFGSQFNRNIGSKINIAHTLTYIPAFRDFSDYVLTSVFSLGYQLSKPLKLTINNVVDYSSQPSLTALKKNSQWFIGLTFGGKA